MTSSPISQAARSRRLSRGPNVALTILYGRRYLCEFPDDVVAWIHVGKALGKVARFEEAEQALTKAIEFCLPEHRQYPLSEIGNLYKESGEYDQAAEWYRRAIAAAPNDAGFYLLLGGNFARQSRFAEAEEVYRAAIACTDGCIDEAYLNLGFVLRALERFAEAADCFREALRLDPDYRAARCALFDVERCLRFERRI